MRGRRPDLQPIEGGKSELLKPPAHFPPAMCGEWNVIVADLMARGLLAESMTGVLASYVSSVWAVSECRKALAKDGFFVKTKTGEPKPHPAAGMLSKHVEIVARLGAELGLTPAARSRKALQGPETATDDDDVSALGV
jgi:P27 family predicted phage terminase small subunit